MLRRGEDRTGDERRGGGRKHGLTDGSECGKFDTLGSAADTLSPVIISRFGEKVSE